VNDWVTIVNELFGTDVSKTTVTSSNALSDMSKIDFDRQAVFRQSVSMISRSDLDVTM
jgi:hypothetical protein